MHTASGMPFYRRFSACNANEHTSPRSKSVLDYFSIVFGAV